MSNISSEYRKEYQRLWHQANRERRLAAAKERKKAIKKWFKEYKSQCKCSRCGFSHPAALDFHHKYDKSMEINKLLRARATITRLTKEIAKCEVLCANCHRILHYEEQEEQEE